MRDKTSSAPQKTSGGFLTPEELLMGSEGEHEVEIPSEILRPIVRGEGRPRGIDAKVRIRPLTMRDVQLIAKAAKTDEVMTSVLMIQQALVEPKLKQQEIAAMHSGLVKFLVEQINRLSGLMTEEDDLRALIESPIAKAFYLLSKEFHWTPDEVKSLTIGQILGYLELLNQSKRLTAV